MSSRRSGRAKAPVKYTSASEGSDFEDKKPRKSATKKAAAATPKKRTKAEQETAPDADADVDGDAEPAPKKRAKKDPETLAAEHTEKAAQQTAKAEKASHKKAWDDWVSEHDVAGALLDEEPSKDESITQTDCAKKYGLKVGELGSLKHFEKKSPAYGNTMKLFLEEEVKVLAYRKAGVLEGVEGDDEKIVKKGREVWKETDKDDAEKNDEKTTKVPTSKPSKPPKAKTPRQKWTAYIESHTSSPENLTEEPESSINQSDSKTKYHLMPADLAVLPYFPKPNPKYGNTTKMFKEDEVKTLAYRKSAVVGGVEEEDEGKLLEKGEEMWKAEHGGNEEGAEE